MNYQEWKETCEENDLEGLRQLVKAMINGANYGAGRLDEIMEASEEAEQSKSQRNAISINLAPPGVKGAAQELAQSQEEKQVARTTLLNQKLSPKVASDKSDSNKIEDIIDADKEEDNEICDKGANLRG